MESNLILPHFSDSKIIFVKNYNKNRNLSESLVIKLPYNKEKSVNFLQKFKDEPETDSKIKPILKNSLRKKRLKLDLPNEREFTKSVKFVDEVDEEDDYFDNSTNYCNINEKQQVTINTNEDVKEKVYLNINTNKAQFNILINTKSGGITEDTFAINFDKQINKKQNISINGFEIEQTKVKFKKSLAEIITIPSFRNCNIYRTGSKDFLKQNIKQGEPDAKCKCCTIF
jgi:hypothetical protein